MNLEFLREKQQSLSALMDALGAVEKALPSLAPAEIADLAAGCVSLVTAERERRGLVGPARDLSGPREAIETLLSGLRAGEGLRTRRIIAALAGRIHTTSKNPTAMLYSTLYHLVKAGRIVRRPDKTYALAPPAPAPEGAS